MLLCLIFAIDKTLWGACSNGQEDSLTALSFSYRAFYGIGNANSDRDFGDSDDTFWLPEMTPPRNFQKIGPDTPSEKKGNSMYAFDHCHYSFSPRRLSYFAFTSAPKQTSAVVVGSSVNRQLPLSPRSPRERAAFSLARLLLGSIGNCMQFLHHHPLFLFLAQISSASCRDDQLFSCLWFRITPSSSTSFQSFPSPFSIFYVL